MASHCLIGNACTNAGNGGSAASGSEAEGNSGFRLSEGSCDSEGASG